MFKNYLTYNFALSFHRSCCAMDVTTEAPQSVKDRLLRSSETMIHHFSRAIYTRDNKEESKCLFVALVALKDCLEIMNENKLEVRDLRSQYQVLEARLEQLAEKACAVENGQMRMLG